MKIIFPEGIRKFMSLDEEAYCMYHIDDDEFVTRIRNSADKFPVNFFIHNNLF